MQQTDDKTLQYYRDNADEIFERYEAVTQSGIAEHFSSSFSPGSKVLDVGAGSGPEPTTRTLPKPVKELSDL